ncbi:hypothetical protein [Corynebacterium camporealensis]
MKAVKAYAASLATPMDILSEVAMLTRAHLQLEGLPQKEITALMSLADVYFGQTPYTRLQATARKTPHSLLVLKDIENKARRIKDPVQRYKFRIACAEVHEDDLNALAKEFLPPPPEPKEGRGHQDEAFEDRQVVLDCHRPIRADFEAQRCLPRHGSCR